MAEPVFYKCWEDKHVNNKYVYCYKFTKETTERKAYLFRQDMIKRHFLELPTETIPAEYTRSETRILRERLDMHRLDHLTIQK